MDNIKTRITIMALQDYAEKCEYLQKSNKYFETYWKQRREYVNNIIKEIQN